MKAQETKYFLSFNLDLKTQNRLRDVSNKIAKEAYLLDLLSDKERDFIHRSVRISNIGSSTRIENAVLTDIEIDWIDTVVSSDAKTTAYLDQRENIQNKLSKDKERSIDEVAGCRAMLQVVYQQGTEIFPLTETSIRALHSYLMEFYKPAAHYAGRYKMVPNTVVQRSDDGEGDVPVLVTSDPGPITEAAMKDLVSWYNEVLPTQTWSIAVACEFVFRFLAIHPFQDGNGRLGRALYLLALIQSTDNLLSKITPYLNLDRQIEKKREEYYLVLRQCSGGKFYQDSKSYNYTPFLNFMLKVVDSAIDDLQFYREQFEKLRSLNLTSYQVLECFKEKAEIRLTASQIVDTCKLPRRTVNDCLVELLGKDFIVKLGQGRGTYYQLVF